MVFLCCFISVVVIIFHNLVLFEVIAVFVASPLMHVLCRSLALGTDLVGAGAWVFHSFFFQAFRYVLGLPMSVLHLAFHTRLPYSGHLFTYFT